MSEAPADTPTPPALVVQTPPAPTAARRHRAVSAGGMVLQVLLIAVGVFLGLAGEEWREDRENRRLATETLRRFRVELVANRETIMAVKDYHAERHAELDAYFAASVEQRDPTVVKFAGLRPLSFERGAWELANATGSLAYIDAELAFLLSRTYAYQNMATDLGRSMMDAMYRDPPQQANSNFFATVSLYYGDMVEMEAGFIATYDELIPAIDAELAE